MPSGVSTSAVIAPTCAPHHASIACTSVGVLGLGQQQPVDRDARLDEREHVADSLERAQAVEAQRDAAAVGRPARASSASRAPGRAPRPCGRDGRRPRGRCRRGRRRRPSPSRSARPSRRRRTAWSGAGGSAFASVLINVRTLCGARECRVKPMMGRSDQKRRAAPTAGGAGGHAELTARSAAARICPFNSLPTRLMNAPASPDAAPATRPSIRRFRPGAAPRDGAGRGQPARAPSHARCDRLRDGVARRGLREPVRRRRARRLGPRRRVGRGGRDRLRRPAADARRGAPQRHADARPRLRRHPHGGHRPPHGERAADAARRRRPARFERRGRR